MAMWNDRSLPYPILAPWTDDYLDKSFGIEVPNAVLSGDGQINVTLRYNLNSEFLLDLIRDGQAEYTTLVVCGRTMARQSFSGQYAETVEILDAADYAETIEFTPYITAKTAIDRFSSDEHNSEFRTLQPTHYSVPGSGVLAVGNRIRIDLDPIGNIDSIFDLVPSTSLERGRFEVDVEDDRIKIVVNRDDRAEIDRWLDQGRSSMGSAALHPALYLHAVTLALTRIDENEERRWTTVFRNRLEALHLETSQEEIDQRLLEYGQRLLQHPLGFMLEALKSDEEE